MELYSYVAGLSPQKHILLGRTDASLTLVPNSNRDANAVTCFDIFARTRIELDPVWLDSEFRVDEELTDLIIDLNLGGFKTSGCCRGKYAPSELPHLDAAYIAFPEYLPPDLFAALNRAGLWCSNVSDQALHANPAAAAFLQNMRSRVNSWSPNGEYPRVPPTAEQIALNTAFEGQIRRVFGDRLPAVSDEIRRMAAGALA